MHDPDPRRDELERLEGLLSPFQKLIALAVALELHVQIKFQRARRTKEIHLHRVIDHEVNRYERFNNFWIATQPRHRATHRRKINNQRHAGEILQHNSRDNEWNFRVCWRFRVPVRQRLDIFAPDFFPVAIAQHGFEHNPNAYR